MKKVFVLAFALVLAFGLVACNNDTDVKSEGVMTYEEYMAAEMDSQVVIEAYVQGHQSWWEQDGQGKITVYAQDKDGGYFLYELNCSKEDAEKLTKGTKIKVTGYKGQWAGEIEIMDGTFEFMDGNWVAEALDVTDLLGKDELIDHQNKVVTFKGMTVTSVSYKNGQAGEDIYVSLTKGDVTCTFVVETDLTGSDSDLYKAVEALQPGAVVDVDGFLYWYEGVNTHITGMTVVEQ